MGGVPVIVQTTAETGFRITPEQLKASCSSRTRFVLFNSPCNPTGAVYTRSELQALAEVIADAGIYVVSDEIYEKILYDDAQHVSIAALNPAVKEKTLVVNGVSKAYAMTGWRVGYGSRPGRPHRPHRENPEPGDHQHLLYFPVRRPRSPDRSPGQR